MSTREDYKQEVIRLAARVAELEEALQAVVEEYRLSKVIGRDPQAMVVFDAFLSKCQAVLAKGGKS